MDPDKKIVTMATLEQMQTAYTKLLEQQTQLSSLMAKFMETQVSEGRGSGKRWFYLDGFKNVKQFGGEQGDWLEFSYKLKSQIGSMDQGAAEVLDSVENRMTEAELEGDVDMLNVEVGEKSLDGEEVKDLSQKLYNILLNLTTAEANAVVRRCKDRNGLLAWKRLCTTLNPRTLASGVKLISQALNPQKITDAKKADVAIETWEDKLAKLQAEYGENLTYKLRLAVMYSMLPKDLQERVLDKCAISWDGTKEQEAMMIFSKIREEVKNVAKSRRDMITPKPMEVDNVYDEWSWWGGPGTAADSNVENNETDEAEEYGVNYIGKGKGKGKCWTCGEPGHRAVECPKGKGKSGGLQSAGWKGGWSKGGTKGGGKYGYYGDKGGNYNGKGGKDGGKGLQMTRACFGCGSTAHLLRDCPEAPVKREVQQVRDEGREVPEVLVIARTTAKDMGWKEAVKKGPRSRTLGDFMAKPPGLSKVKVHNGFKILEVDEDEGEAEQCRVQCVECVNVERTIEKPAMTPRTRREPKRTGITKQKACEECVIGAVEKQCDMAWASLGIGEIVVDSAADESCWPKDQGGPSS